MDYNEYLSELAEKYKTTPDRIDRAQKAFSGCDSKLLAKIATAKYGEPENWGPLLLRNCIEYVAGMILTDEKDFCYGVEALNYHRVRTTARDLLSALHNHFPPCYLDSPWEEIREALSETCAPEHLLNIAALLRSEGITEEDVTREWIEAAPVHHYPKRG